MALSPRVLYYSCNLPIASSHLHEKNKNKQNPLDYVIFKSPYLKVPSVFYWDPNRFQENLSFAKIEASFDKMCTPWDQFLSSCSLLPDSPRSILSKVHRRNAAVFLKFPLATVYAPGLLKSKVLFCSVSPIHFLPFHSLSFLLPGNPTVSITKF